jgi:hypothetical protein
MQEITIYGNWCDYDQLDGRNVEDGERMLLRWPDGVTEEHVVRVEKRMGQTGDMGHMCDLPIRKAYIEHTVHDVTIKIMLYGTGVCLQRLSSEAVEAKPHRGV